MAYSELIKNFSCIRDYMWEFYVYGFKSRDEYTKKSARSYDDERRRLESWLGDYMRFRQTSEGKNVFLSIDSRVSRHNPLYAAWKAKSFTDGDITLHFILFDILYSPDISLPLTDITEAVDSYLLSFNEPRLFDSSTVRKKLNEYVSEGIIVSEKRGKTMYYRRADETETWDMDVLDFFSEIAPCGVIGSYLLDKAGTHDEHFAFKHHYITSAMDSEVVCALFTAISEKRNITLETVNRHKDRISENALAVIDTSGSMYCGAEPVPATVALSLGLYFAEHNTGAFRNHFIEFSVRPQLIEIKGETFADRLRYVASFNEVANTNLEAVFDMILNAAVKNNVPSSELPAKLIIISDMEFDCCVDDASAVNFKNAQKKYEACGYKLPQIIFWNVASRNRQPVTQNEQGVALISGVTPRIFSMVAGGILSPYTFMMEVLGSERYAKIAA